MYAGSNIFNYDMKLILFIKVLAICVFYLCQRAGCLGVTNSEVEDSKSFIRGSRRPVNISVILG